ncbi:putative butyrate kinase [Bacteroidia bacterium]|nr:putative butyrate kinase [Bacteroidia bacterium]
MGTNNMDSYILAINPGSTSTKIAVYHGKRSIVLKNISHSREELEPFEKVIDQFEFRKQTILAELHNSGIELNKIQYIIGRGGMCRPISSGIYEVNKSLKEDLRIGYMGEHASNLGGLLADDLASSIKGAKAYIADPVVVDELEPVARISGHPLIERASIFHALNQKMIARNYANTINSEYEKLNLIIAHLGGGSSISAHFKGKVIDTTNGLYGEGPFSPDRAGELPAMPLVDLCFNGKYTKSDIYKIIAGKGGFIAYLGSNNMIEIMHKSTKNKFAKLIVDAFTYQVSKSICAMSAVLQGQVDAILITGGIAYNRDIIDDITKHVAHISRVRVYPGENEMEALASNVMMMLEKKIKPKFYGKKDVSVKAKKKVEKKSTKNVKRAEKKSGEI